MLPSWAVTTPERRAHVERVAELLGRWADAMGLGPERRSRWLRAAYLHDALRDAPLDDPLAHGPAAADRAAAVGERDRGVLDAVRYHSLGWAGWDDVGRALYCADFLEPGRPYLDEERAALARAYAGAADRVLYEVARLRVSHSVRSGQPLAPATVAFWNALCAARE